MLPALVEIPPVNPLRFIQVGQTTDPRYNLRHFDAEWFKDLIRPWQYKTEYYQKYQFNHRQALQFNANTTRPCTLQVYDCSGTLRHTWTQSSYLSVTNNTITQPGTQLTLPAQTYTFKFSFNQVPGLTDGIYYLYLTVNFDLDGDNVTDQVINLISEPISVAVTHYEAALLEYWNSTNAQDVLFTQTALRFSLCIEADVVDYGPASHDTQYEDQEYNAVMLSSTPYRTAKFALTRRAPVWLLDKLNRAWSCDNVKVGGKFFTKEIGGQWEVNRMPRVPKVTAALPIREANNKDAGISYVPASLLLYTAPPYPYAIRALSMGETTPDYDITDGFGWSMESPADETDYVSYLNSTISLAYGLSGTFGMTNGALVYVNGDGEIFDTASSIILDALMIIDIELQTGSDVVEFSLFGGFAVVAWSGNRGMQYGDGSSAGFNITNTYPTVVGSQYTINIYHDNGATGFFSGYAGVTGFGGFVPTSTEQFLLANNQMTTFNAFTLASAYNHLELLRVENCKLTSVTGFLIPFTNLNDVRFNINRLSQTAVNTLFNTFVIQSTINANGYWQIDGQTPPAPPTSASAASRGLLTSNGWTIVTD